MKLFQSALIGFLLFASCTGKRSDPGSSAGENIILTEVICIMEDAPLYEEPGTTSPVISSVQLGEVIQIITDDPTGQEPNAGKYYEIQLHEGMSAWISGSAIYTNAVPAAILKEATIYSSPDANTRTGKNFFLAEFGVITGEHDTWVKLTGAGKKKEGWIKKETVSTDPSDVTVAILAESYLLEDNGTLIKDKLPEFMRQLPDRDTKLAVELQKLVEIEVVDAIEQSIMEYEHENFDEELQFED